MLTVPKGIWGQAGYNAVYGFSGGLGLNITEQIAIEYNFEKAVGDLTTFGSSHEITLAYKFKKKENFYYGGNDEETAFVIPKKRRKVIANANTSVQLKARQAKAKESQLAQEAEEDQANSSVVTAVPDLRIPAPQRSYRIRFLRAGIVLHHQEGD